MKRFLALCLTASLLLLLVACGAPAAKSGLQIVVTNFPAYDFARQVCGDLAEVTLLLPPGTESHSYEPSPKDTVKIQNCDLFLCVGGESDAWVEQLLAAMSPAPRTLYMMDAVETVEEELAPGMAPETEEPGATSEYDEHVWTSPINAAAIVNAIAKEMMQIDAVHEQQYNENAAAYRAQLTALHEKFQHFFAGVQNKTLIFGDRFPLRYFTDAYGLTYYAAFPGCSNETEPGVATVTFLVDKVREENISTVFYIEFSNHRVADTIAESAHAKTALFHSCHNVTKEQMAQGITYLDLMEQNLQTLQQALK